jgi:hypothetical protein
MQKERQDETQFTTKIDGFFFGVSSPLLNANVLFCRFLFVMTKLGVLLVLRFSYFTDNSNILPKRKINI